MLNSKSISTLYKYVNALINASRSVASLCISGKILTLDADKVHTFNTLFRSVFTAPTNLKLFPQTDEVRSNSTSNNFDFSPYLLHKTMRKAI